MNIWQGKNIRLRAVELGDADFLHEINGDSDLKAMLNWISPPRSLSAIKKEIEDGLAKTPEDDSFRLIIENPQGVKAGCVMAHSCDRRTGVFRYGICIHSEHRRQGYAREAALLLLRYFFNHLRYQKVNAGAYSYNLASQRLQESLGFVLEGRIRRTVFCNGAHHDCLQYGMTIEEFRAKYPE